MHTYAAERFHKKHVKNKTSEFKKYERADFRFKFDLMVEQFNYYLHVSAFFTNSITF